MLCETPVDVLPVSSGKNSIGEKIQNYSGSPIATIMCKVIPYRNDYVLKQYGVISNEVKQFFSFDKLPQGKYVLRLAGTPYSVISYKDYDSHCEILAEKVEL